MDPNTFPKFLVQHYQKWGNKRVALRKKDYGIWQEYAWKDYYENVKWFSLGLISLGLERGDKVCMIGDNDHRWIWAQFAAQAAGAISLGCYQDSMAHEMQFIIDQSDSKFVVVEDQEQVDKMLDIKDHIPKVKKVIYWDPKGLRTYTDLILMTFEEVLELGREYEKAHLGLFEENVEKGKGDDVAVIAYTSGTTGFPKGVMLTHGGMIDATLCNRQIEAFGENDQWLSYTPLSWMGEQYMTILKATVVGGQVNFPEEPETAEADIREVGMTCGIVSPRILERLLSSVQVKISDGTFLRKLAYKVFMPVGYKVADIRLAKRKPNLFWKALYLLAWYAMLRPIRDTLGLLKTRWLLTGGQTIAPEAVRFYHAIGVRLKQVYALTEVGAVPISHTDDDIKLDTVGTPVPGSEVRISDTGEILLKTPSTFVGYYKNPEATAKVFRDGWLLTGDQGVVDEDGHVIMIDRMSDVSQLKSGSKFSPEYISSKLRYSPYIADAVIVGDGQDYVAALVAVDIITVGKWVEDRQIPYTTYADLSQKPEVYDLVKKAVEMANKTLPKATRVKKFTILYKQLDPDDAELTRTRKVRRAFVEQRYGPLLDALYGSGEEVLAEADVTYRDGRKAKVKTSLKVVTLEEE